MNQVREVTGTAFIVAEFRARENEQANPLYRDPVVHIFLDESTKKAAAAIRADFPAGEKMPRLRTRYYDDRLDAQLADGCRQVVILGSGLDTRAVRKQTDGVAFFEIDDARPLSSRKHGLRRMASMRGSPSFRATMSPRACSRCFRATGLILTCPAFSSGKAIRCT